eukprot:365462-Chlamydomonas_euryale.AAC.10
MGSAGRWREGRSSRGWCRCGPNAVSTLPAWGAELFAHVAFLGSEVEASGGGKVCDQVVGECSRYGLVYGALCNDCDLAARDVDVIASGKASVKSKE